MAPPRCRTEHAVLRPNTWIGAHRRSGKYTTYRVMAADAVDAASPLRTGSSRTAYPPSKTDELPLVGAAGYAAAWATENGPLAKLDFRWQLLNTCAFAARRPCRTVLDLIASDPKLAEPMHPDSPYLFAEELSPSPGRVVWPRRCALVRRTRLALGKPGAEVSTSPNQWHRFLRAYANWDEADIAEQVAVVALRRDAHSRFRAAESTSKLWPWTTELPPTASKRHCSKGGIATGLPVEGPKRLGCCHDGTCRPTASFHASHQRPVNRIGDQRIAALVPGTFCRRSQPVTTPAIAPFTGQPITPNTAFKK